jgi:carbon-monoxide dehydrogenase medium subunit
LKWIDYARPSSVQEAVGLLDEHGDRARTIAGGTDILVQLRTGRRRPDLIVDVKGIPELMDISYDSSNGLTLGAAVPCYRLYGDAAVRDAYPGLMDAATLIGGIQIQGRASFGGNLCNAAPSADAIPALIAHGATANISGPDGDRQVPVEDFCTGPGASVLKPNELLVSIHVPAPGKGFGARYIRFIPRNEMDIAVAGAGVSVVLDNGSIRSARVSLASVAPTPLLVNEAGEALAGKAPTDENIRVASDLARSAARPIDDMRGTIEYRKHLCEVLTRRALHTAVERAKEAE